MYLLKHLKPGEPFQVPDLHATFYKNQDPENHTYVTKYGCCDMPFAFPPETPVVPVSR